MNELFASPRLTFWLAGLPIVSLSWACQSSQSVTRSTADAGRVQSVQCDYAPAKQGDIARFTSMMQAGFGSNPKTLPLKNEKKPGATTLNPLPEEADSFIRAASGVRIIPLASGSLKVLVAQDSRRKIGVAEMPADFAKAGGNQLAAKISMIPIDSDAQIAKLEDDKRDYETYRKAFKLDFEASSTLPNGDMLFVGSGSDILQHGIPGKASYRSQARVLNASGVPSEQYDLIPFYLHVNAMKDLIGEANQEGPAQINFEGLAVRPEGKGHKIAFFNRGNFNGNGYNAMIEYEFSTWLSTLRRTQKMSVEEARQVWSTINYIRIIRIQMPRVASLSDPSGATFPITLNDALSTAKVPANRHSLYLSERKRNTRTHKAYSTTVK